MYVEIAQHAPARTINLGQRPCVFVYTDASLEPTERGNVAGLGGVLCGPTGEPLRFFSVFPSAQELSRIGIDLSSWKRFHPLRPTPGFVSVSVVTLFAQALKSYYPRKASMVNFLRSAPCKSESVYVQYFGLQLVWASVQKEVLQKRDEKGFSTAHDKSFCVCTQI